MMSPRRRPPPLSQPPSSLEEEILRLPCCLHTISVDKDTPVGAETTCLFCGSRLILRGRPGTTRRFFAKKGSP